MKLIPYKYICPTCNTTDLTILDELDQSEDYYDGDYFDDNQISHDHRETEGYVRTICKAGHIHDGRLVKQCECGWNEIDGYKNCTVPFSNKNPQLIGLFDND